MQNKMKFTKKKDALVTRKEMKLKNPNKGNYWDFQYQIEEISEEEVARVVEIIKKDVETDYNIVVRKGMLACYLDKKTMTIKRYIKKAGWSAIANSNGFVTEMDEKTVTTKSIGTDGNGNRIMAVMIKCTAFSKDKTNHHEFIGACDTSEPGKNTFAKALSMAQVRARDGALVIVAEDPQSTFESFDPRDDIAKNSFDPLVQEYLKLCPFCGKIGFSKKDSKCLECNKTLDEIVAHVKKVKASKKKAAQQPKKEPKKVKVQKREPLKPKINKIEEEKKFNEFLSNLTLGELVVRKDMESDPIKKKMLIKVYEERLKQEIGGPTPEELERIEDAVNGKSFEEPKSKIVEGIDDDGTEFIHEKTEDEIAEEDLMPTKIVKFAPERVDTTYEDDFTSELIGNDYYHSIKNKRRDKWDIPLSIFKRVVDTNMGEKDLEGINIFYKKALKNKTPQDSFVSLSKVALDSYCEAKQKGPLAKSIFKIFQTETDSLLSKMIDTCQDEFNRHEHPRETLVEFLKYAFKFDAGKANWAIGFLMSRKYIKCELDIYSWNDDNGE